MIAAIGGWLASPLIKIALIGLALFSAVAVIDRRATYRERARCETAAMRAERDAALQDLRAEKIARTSEQQTIVVLEDEKGKADAAVDKFKAELAQRPVAAQCLLSDDDARQLR